MNRTRLRLVDTAGIRRRAAVAASRDGAEPLSVDRSFKAIRRSDVAVLVLDALDGVTQQDFRYGYRFYIVCKDTYTIYITLWCSDTCVYVYCVTMLCAKA